MKTSSFFDFEAQALAKALPQGRRIGIIGSTSFWSPLSGPFCRQLGAALAVEPDVVLLTGGMPGVAAETSTAFEAVRKRLQLTSSLVSLVPFGTSSACPGMVLKAGFDMAHRRELLGRLATTFLVVEGGPGTAHEAVVAQAHGARLIPVAATGGVAARLGPMSRADTPEARADWAVLRDRRAPTEAMVSAALALCFAAES